jgi:tetratricopeptide (TPR) repeat protein
MPGRRAPRAPILWFVAYCALPPANARAAVAPSAPPWPVVADEAADEAAAFVVGLAAKDLHELVLKEGRAFLAAHAAHAEATLVRHLVAEAAYALARYDEARADFERVVAVPGFAQVREARFRLGQCALELGDARAAAAAFEALIASGADYLRPAAGFLLGEARFALREFEAAEAAYHGVLQLDEPGSYGFDAACAMCWTAKERGALDAVVARATACLAAAPADDTRASALWLLLGETQFARGAHGEALASFERVRGPEQVPAARRGAAFALVALGRDGEAALRFEALAAEAADGAARADATWRAAAAHVRAGANERALALLAGAQEPHGLLWRGRALLALGRHAEALSAFDVARRAGPDTELAAELARAHAEALVALGRGAEAAELLERSGGDHDLHVAAVAHANLGDWAAAVRSAQAALARFPDSPHATANRLVLAEALFQLGDRNGARVHFEAVAASAAREDAERARLRLCWCDFADGRFDAAQGAFGALARGDGAVATEAQFMAARALEELAALDRGEASRARAADAFARFVEERPGATQRPEAFVRLARLVPPAEAEAALRRLLAEHADHALCGAAALELAQREAARGEHGAALANFERALAGGAERAATLVGRAASQLELGAHDAARASLVEVLEIEAREFEARGGEARDVGPQGAESPGAESPGAGSERPLRLAALELLAWVEAARGDGAAATEVVHAFARSAGDHERVLAAARRVHGVLTAQGAAERGAGLFAALASGAREPRHASVFAAEEVFAWLDAALAARAEERLRAALASAPADAGLLEAAFFVGEAHWSSGEHARALALYDLAAALPGTTRERALYKGGFAAQRLGDTAGAESRFGRFAEQFEESALLGEVLALLGELRSELGRDADAVDALVRMRARFPRHELALPALFRLGVCQARLGRHADAARSLADLVRAAPDFPARAEAELWRGRALAALGDRRAARAALAAVLERDAGLLAARARLELGELARADSDLEAALGEFLKVAVLYEPCDEVAEALVRAGLVLEERGDEAGARARYREVVADHATRPAAATAAARIAALDRR